MPPTNVYFNNYAAKGEQRLYEDLINETIKQWGIDSYYLPRTSESSVDLIFGDDPTKKYDESYPVEVYVKNVDNFNGQELFSKFGLEIQHQISFIMTTRAFAARVPSVYERPREGDLLWLTNFQALFEIKNVNQQHFFYAFGNSNFYGFELVCEKFRYSDELIDSGVIEISDALDDRAFAYNYIMNNDATNAAMSYKPTEKVYQGANVASATATATVISWDKPTRTLKLKDIYGQFTSGVRVFGDISGANYSMNSVNLLENVNDLLDNNSELRVQANNILDFSEINPFGRP